MSIRTLAGYRLYDDTDLERLQHILLFRELEFPLKDIQAILSSPDFDRNKALDQRIQGFITENMYTCTPKILSGLGKMYSGGGEFTENIDSWGGEGTGAFLDKAIQIYCDNAE